MPENHEGELSLSSVLSAVQLRALRTRLLIELDRVYPKRVDDATLRLLDVKTHSQRMVNRELYYMAEKQLIALCGEPERCLFVTITARGRDFLNGDVSEPGIEPASIYGYEGPENVR